MSQHDDQDDAQHAVAHDESNWLVSYADMMTLLFGFFVLMYSMSRVDQDKFTIVSRDVARFFGGKVKDDAGVRIATEDVKKYIGSLLKDMHAANKLEVKDDKALIVGGLPDTAVGGESDQAEIAPENQIEVEQRASTMTLKFRGAILFTPGSAQLKPEFEKVLNELALKLKASGRVEQIQVEGHTDDIPIKSVLFPTNWELSAARAARVVRQLEANGFEDKQLVAEGFGSSQPDVPVSGADGQPSKVNRAMNRRVVVHVRFQPSKSADDKTVQDEYFEKVKHAKEQPAAKVSDTGSIGDASGGDVEKRISDAQARLEEAQRRLKSTEEADKKRKKLEDLEKKLTDLNKKAAQVEERLKQKVDSPLKAAPASVPEGTQRQPATHQ